PRSPGEAASSAATSASIAAASPSSPARGVCWQAPGLTHASDVDGLPSSQTSARTGHVFATAPMNDPNATGVRPTGSVSETVLVLVSMTETLDSVPLATYARPRSGSTPTPSGPLPTGILSTTAFVSVAITDTVSSAAFATKARARDVSTATP